MFSPRRAPKEGRSLPSYTKFNDGGRARFGPRRVTITAVIALCLFVGYFIFTSEAGAPKLKTPITKTKSTSKTTKLDGALEAKSERERNKDTADAVQALIKKPLDKVQAPASSKQKVIEDEEDTPKTKAKLNADDFPKAKASSPRESWTRRAQVDQALAKVVELMPDEVHMRELIRPVESTGKERMREMGLRTRAYAKYFDAWEKLHLIEDAEGSTYIRDDIIQYILGQQSASKEDADSQVVAQTIHTYEAYRAFLKNFGKLLFPWTAPWFGDHMTLHTSFKKGGRGIVLTVGDEQAPYVLTTIYTYRKLGCTLPIEILYLGDPDLDLDYRAELESLPGVVTRDLAQMVDDEGWRLAGWAAKPFAMLFSSFREVIFIDADALFFKNPEILFDDPDYIKHGALFFKDRIIMPENKKRWLQQVLPKPIPKIARQSRFWTGESGHQQESGVVVVDKWKHFMSMMLMTRFNGPDRDGKKEQGIVGVYDMVYGDKETVWLSFLLAGDEDFAFHGGDAGILGELSKPEDSEDGEKDKDGSKKDEKDAAKEDADTKAIDTSEPSNYTICAPQLLHLDLEGKPFWFNGWLLKNKFVEKSKKTFADFDHYLIEPREVREPTPWQLAESNLCCLTADNKYDFTQQEKDTLKMILDRAHEMGMGDQT